MQDPNKNKVSIEKIIEDEQGETIQEDDINNRIFDLDSFDPTHSYEEEKKAQNKVERETIEDDQSLLN